MLRAVRVEHSRFAVMLLLVLATGLAVRAAQTPQTAPEEALLGFDPILLIGGKEELGKDDLAVVHDGLRYLFVNADNKRRFESDPKRYGVQLGAVCARMGGTVFGSADRFAVFNGRIYLFGSEDCRKKFVEASEKYLEPAVTPITAGRDAVARGKALLDKAAGAAGGAAALDRLEALQERWMRTRVGPNGTQELHGTLTWRLPDRLRDERVFGGSPFASVLAGDQAFMAAPDLISPIRSGQRDAVRHDLARQVLVILHARRDPAVSVASLGRDRVGDLEVEQVAVVYRDTACTLGIDPTTGRVLTQAFVGRGSAGLVGRIVRTFSDFRPISGLTLPFTTTGTFEGNPSDEHSWRTLEIAVNDAVPASLFEPRTTR